jgi:xanthine dehydrogenase YagS FAD-binding subunit
VLGTSDHCIATHPSDLAVALAALDASVRVRGARERVIPFTAFHVLPGSHPERETILAPGELITSIDLPALPFAKRSLYLKVRDRASYAFALASAAVALDLNGRTIRGARVALGGVGTKPWRSHEAERVLTGKPANEATFRAAATAALADAKPRRDNAFKVVLAKRTLVRALMQVSS